MNFDAQRLARSWLAVALASGGDDETPALSRTVSVEEFAGGVRLTATDRSVILTSWVPALYKDDEQPPSLDEAPVISGVLVDTDERAKNLMTFLLKLAKRYAKANGSMVECRLVLDAEAPPEGEQAPLDGFGGTWGTLEHVGQETVWLRVYEGEYPNWRDVLTSFAPKRTDEIALNPEYLGVLSALGRLHDGQPIELAWGGKDKAARIESGCLWAKTSGLLMPVSVNKPKQDPDPE